MKKRILAGLLLLFLSAQGASAAALYVDPASSTQLSNQAGATGSTAGSTGMANTGAAGTSGTASSNAYQIGYPTNQTGGYLANQTGGYPVNQTGGYLANQTGGYPVNQTGGYPVNQTVGYPVNQTGGYPVNQTGGYPVNQAGGYQPGASLQPGGNGVPFALPTGNLSGPVNYPTALSGSPTAGAAMGTVPGWQNLRPGQLPYPSSDPQGNQAARLGGPNGPSKDPGNPASLQAQTTGDQGEPSSAEKMMSAEDENLMKPQPFVVGKLNQFGYNFFRQPASFAPQVDVPVGPDYLIGPGDTLILTVWGSVDLTLALEVNRSGEVVLPRVGSARVWGVPYGKVGEVIRSALSRTFKNVQLNVTMGKLRLMKVYVVGEVNAPGDYDVSALSTVINALAAAGGPTKEGSLRTIQVLRAGKVVETVDLYNFFLKGDKSRDIRLRPGDTINVPVHGKLVGIAGNARKPAIYEFSDLPTLKDLVEMAGGISSAGYLQRVQISRVEQNQKKVAADFSFDPGLSPEQLQARLSEVKLQDMDLVKILPIDFTVRNHVLLDGYVLRPGSYALKPGMRLGDVASRDNMLPEYCSDTVELTRLVLPDYHTERLYLNLDRALQGDLKENILLQEFDTVRVFSRWEMEEVPRARVSGEVQNPGLYRIFPNTTLRDLILAAGNVKKTAYLKSTEITRSEISKDGVRSRLINVDLDEALKGSPAHNIQLDNYDEVMVRRLPEWKEETDRYFVLTGEVRFPGVYPIVKGERLSSLIERAGGYTSKAYLKSAKFTRKLTRELQQKRMDEVIARTERDLTRKQQELTSVAASKEELEATKATIEGMKTSLEKLKLAKAEGRISIDLSALEVLKKSPYDLELQGGDTLDIPMSSNSVMVYGEVYNPTTVVLSPGEEVKHYLEKAGGPTVNAEESEMYVVRADGTVVSKRAMRGLFFNGFMSLVLDAGDTVVVPQRMEKVAWVRDLKDIAFIIGQTALAAGVIVAAGL